MDGLHSVGKRQPRTADVASYSFPDPTVIFLTVMKYVDVSSGQPFIKDYYRFRLCYGRIPGDVPAVLCKQHDFYHWLFHRREIATS